MLLHIALIVLFTWMGAAALALAAFVALASVAKPVDKTMRLHFAGRE